MLFSSSLESSASYSDYASFFLLPNSFSMLSYSWAAMYRAWDLAERGDAFTWSRWPLSLTKLLIRLFTDMFWDMLSGPESSSRLPSSSLFGVAAFEFLRPIWISCTIRSPNSSSVLDCLLSWVLVLSSSALVFNVVLTCIPSWCYFPLTELEMLLAIIFWLFSVFLFYLYASFSFSANYLLSGSGCWTDWPIMSLSWMLS